MQEVESLFDAQLEAKGCINEYSLSWPGPATYGCMYFLIEEHRKLETITASGSIAIPIPRQQKAVSLTVEPASKATSESENEAGDHDASDPHTKLVYTSLETVTDSDGPPFTAEPAPEVPVGSTEEVRVAPVDKPLRTCIVVGIGGPSGVGKTALVHKLVGVQISVSRVARECCLGTC